MQTAPYVLPGVGMIPLRARDGSVRAWTVVDLADHASLSSMRWFLDAHGYAAHTTPRPNHRGVLLHRFLLGLDVGDGRYGDHKNRIRLDNRRENLRVVTRRQNNQNTSSQRGVTSAHRGVSWDKNLSKWTARAGLDGKCWYLGVFADELEAAEVAAGFRRRWMPYSMENR
jgi:hypothetical protein